MKQPRVIALLESPQRANRDAETYLVGFLTVETSRGSVSETRSKARVN
jgi:hypothetical protein